MHYFIEKVKSLKKICDGLSVGKRTVSDWKKLRKEFEDFCSEMVAKGSLDNKATIITANNSTLMKLYLFGVPKRGSSTFLSRLRALKKGYFKVKINVDVCIK